MIRSSQLRNEKPFSVTPVTIPKAPTYVHGLDAILKGGLPEGRITLVGGGPGTGKTIFGLEYVYRGALSGEPGIFLTFEESAENIRQNALSLGWDLAGLEASGKLFIMEGVLDPKVVLSGEFSLMGSLSIIEGKAKEIGARRIVIDALDVVLGYFNDVQKEKQQIHTLQSWLVKLGLTTVLTTKSIKGAPCPAPYDYLDFLADCVIYLDQRIENQVNTKRLQIIKYRGSGYGSNEYPYLLTASGLYFHAISDMALRFDRLAQRLSSGNTDLDGILGGGYFKGTCVLISGMTGTGKTSIAATFAQTACHDGHKVLYLNFEESRSGMLVAMRSIGLDLEKAIQDGRLSILAQMPESRGIEEHLYELLSAIERFEPDHLVVDAISACKRIAGEKASFDFVMRLVNYCKRRGITVLLINQSLDPANRSAISGIGISSIIDTILYLHNEDDGQGDRRFLKVVKSRGTQHSHKQHNFHLSDYGVRIG